LDNWVRIIIGFVGLVIGFGFKIVFDELRSPNLKIVGVSQPSGISPEIKISGEGFDNFYSAYRIRVENKQKPFLNCAAENCMAWLELNPAPESYQICWVGNCPDVTINVGDVREVDFVARGETTGRIFAPTERGYFEPSPREIGDGKTDLQGSLKITSKNGKREEKRFVIKPNKEQLEIIFADRRSKEADMADSSASESNMDLKPLVQEIKELKEEIKKSNTEGKFRFQFGVGLALIAIGIGVQLSPAGSLGRMPVSVLALLFYILGGYEIMVAISSRSDLKGFHKRLMQIGSIILFIGALMISVPFLGEFTSTSWLTNIGILVAGFGFILMEISLITLPKR
jgi:hypothetical protein